MHYWLWWSIPSQIIYKVVILSGAVLIQIDSTAAASLESVCDGRLKRSELARFQPHFINLANKNKTKQRKKKYRHGCGRVNAGWALDDFTSPETGLRGGGKWKRERKKERKKERMKEKRPSLDYAGLCLSRLARFISVCLFLLQLVTWLDLVDASNHRWIFANLSYLTAIIKAAADCPLALSSFPSFWDLFQSRWRCIWSPRWRLRCRWQ